MPDAVSGARASAERWREISAAIDQALELPPDERAAFISRRYPADDPLRRELERFLAACEEVERRHGLLGESADAIAAPILADLERNAERLAEAQRELVTEALAPRYLVERELGRGGMAGVYLARDTAHDRPVAIKVLRQELAMYVGAERFVREIRITSALAHPRIVPLLDSGSAGALLYYVMPYVEGGSLRDRMLREGQLPTRDVASLARDIAEALDVAHARGIVHRDIKPQNILLEAGRAVVADFGIARAIEVAGSAELTQSAVIGTPPYMSPEQAGGERRVDARSDVYSLACVTYEALAGEPPYTGGSSHAIIAKHLHAPIPDVRLVRPDLPAAVHAVLASALAKRPADRPQSAGEFARTLAEALAQASRGRVFPPSGRFPRARAGATVLGLAGVAALGLALWPKQQPPSVGPAIPRVAVLYLEDRSQRGDLSYLASGLTEDLIDALGQLRGLHVASPNAVRPYAGSSLPVDSIARALGASVLVSGSITGDAGRLRVAVRLTDGTSGELIGSLPAQDQPRANVLAIRDSIVSRLVPALRERLGSEIRLRERLAQTHSLAAWELVRLADDAARDGATSVRDGANAVASVRLARADSLYARAALADPEWDMPLVGRARVAYSRAFLFDDSRWATNSAMREALVHADEAVRRNPRSAEALAMRGQLRHLASLAASDSTADSLSRLAELDLNAAIDRRSDFASALYWLGDLLYTQARFTESLRALQRAYAADAFLTEIRDVASRLFDVSLQAERYDDAARWCALGARRFAGDPRFTQCDLMLLGWTGNRARDVSEAWRRVYDIERQDAQGVLAPAWAFRRMMVAAVIARAGLADSARAVLRTVESERRAHPERQLDPFVEAYVRALLGDRARAIALIRQRIAGSARARAYAAHSPWFESLHSNEEFRALVGL